MSRKEEDIAYPLAQWKVSIVFSLSCVLFFVRKTVVLILNASAILYLL